MESTAEVMYEEERVGDQRLDFVVGNRLAIELKALERLQDSHRAQTRTYLRTIRFERAILISFPNPRQPEPKIEVLGSERTVSDARLDPFRDLP